MLSLPCESVSYAGDVYTVGGTVGFYRVLTIRRRPGEGKQRCYTIAVECLHCGHRHEFGIMQLRKVSRGLIRSCNACKVRWTGNRVVIRGCRTCDDCPALRPATGCPGCGEFPVRRAVLEAHGEGNKQMVELLRRFGAKEVQR